MSSIKNPLAAILDSNKFTGLNYQDWLRNLNIVLASEKLLLVVQPISVVPNSGTRPPCPTCKKNHSGQCLFGQRVCYTCGKPGHMSRECSQKRPLITGRAYIMTAAETPADTSAATGKILLPICLH
ncbi:hypothetical protein F511_36105 [Dorcoceras hygrometricum]|uniref:CCHC-type domain-containing protein n=1 Tax=Dorcoceras hygrometricum TaxID=472368 RepID=A0A2Z7DAY7_9LAMI|nr:hypothetical protein F511_36105 [Dorcoceras hygrometricum]